MLAELSARARGTRLGCGLGNGLHSLTPCAIADVLRQWSFSFLWVMRTISSLPEKVPLADECSRETPSGTQDELPHLSRPHRYIRGHCARMQADTGGQNCLEIAPPCDRLCDSPSKPAENKEIAKSF